MTSSLVESKAIHTSVYKCNSSETSHTQTIKNMSLWNSSESPLEKHGWQNLHLNQSFISCLSDVIKMSFQIKQSSFCCQPMTGYTGGNEKIGIVLWHCFELTCKLIQVFHVNWYSRQFHLTCHISLFACSFGVLLCLFCDSKTSIWILNPATLHPCSHASLRPFCVRLRL